MPDFIPNKKVVEIGISHPECVLIKTILSEKKHDDNFCVLDGYWALQKAADAGMKIHSFIYCKELLSSQEASEIFDRYLTLTDNIFSVSEKCFSKLSDRDDSVGMTAVAEFPSFSAEQVLKEKLVVVLDGLEQPGNIGTILRTCDGAGVKGVIVVNRHAGYKSQKVIKSSMGAAFTVPVIEFDSVEELISELKKYGFTIYLADTRAEHTYRAEDYHYPAAIVAGCERYGISKGWYDGSEKMIKIPMRGISDSLNVGVAASIFIYEMSGRIFD